MSEMSDMSEMVHVGPSAGHGRRQHVSRASNRLRPAARLFPIGGPYVLQADADPQPELGVTISGNQMMPFDVSSSYALGCCIAVIHG